MINVATIKFIDVDSGDDAYIFVRAKSELAGLGLSLMKNGDIEVFFGERELDQLIEALQKAREIVGKKP